jgi:hypothetical protein
VSRLAFAMPRPLGFVEQQRLVLLVRGLNHVPAAAPVLEDWCETLQLAYRKWRQDPTAKLSRADVEGLVGGDPQRIRLTSLILQREGWALGSGWGGPDDDWSREINSAVRDAREAKSAAEIIAARDKTEFPLPQPDQPASERNSRRRQLRSWLGSLWRLVSENTLIATVLAGLILLALSAYVIHSAQDGGQAENVSDQPSQSSGQSSTNPSQSVGRVWPEQAGGGGSRAFAKPGSSVGEGPRLQPNQHVEVLCKVYDPEPPSVVPDGYWYLVKSQPWNGRYWAPANSFWNGDIPGHMPYTHNTDFSVRAC